MKVFISYAREDIETARKLYHDLKQAGISPWMDKEDILIGENWKVAIRQAMKESSYFLALLSSNSLSKQGYVQKELKMALDILSEMPPSGIFLLPVRLDDCHPLDERLQDINWGDLFPSYEEGFQKILRVLSQDRQKAASSPGKKENISEIPVKKEAGQKETQPLKTESSEEVSRQANNKQSIGVTGDPESSVLVSGNGNVINIVQPKRNRIGMILTILVVSAIVAAGIMKFYPSEKQTKSDSSLRTITPASTPKPDPPVTVTPPPQPKPSDKEFTNSLGMKFVKIPAGSFMMGSPKDEPGRYDDETQHKVTISKPLFMQTTEVTQGQWKAVMGNNPSSFKDCGDNCPVESVSWDDVQDFIKKLNQKGEGTYRLPTEAEWEYAARAGSATAFSWGDNADCSRLMYENDVGSSENKCVEYVRKRGLRADSTAPVMSYPPNAWGLYDMHGNVWEWCQDWKGDYPSGDVTDPVGHSSGLLRVLRGGSWFNFAWVCRAAYSGSDSPGNRQISYGFRLVLSSGH